MAVVGAVGASATATAASLSVAKLVIVGALSAAVGSSVTLVAIRGLPGRPPAPRTSAPRVEPRAPVAPNPPSVPKAEPAAQAPEQVPATRPEPTVIPEAPKRRPSVAQPAIEPVPLPLPVQAPPEPEPETPAVTAPPAPAPAPLSAAAGLAEELRLLARVLSATQEKRWGDAQRELDEHTRRFSPAALGSEARALQVLVWCGVGRVDEARRLARELEKVDPLNPAVQRLAGSCAK